MKKITSFILIVVLMLCMATPALASNEEIRRQNIIESILEKYPNADINIGEDGAINVFLPNIQTAAPFSTTVYRLYAPEGGTYTGFYPPSGVLPEESPVFISYMPGETARFFRDVREDKNLFYDILDFYVSYQQNVDETLAFVAARLGYSITPATLMAVVVCTSFVALQWLDVYSINKAMAAGTADSICLITTNTGGLFVNTYLGWGKEYVTPDPYANWNPTWRPEEWPIF